MSYTHYDIHFVFAESANSLPAKSEEEQTDASMQKKISNYFMFNGLCADTLSGSELPSTLEVEQRDMNKGIVYYA